MKKLVLIVLILSSCGTIILPKFPTISPKWKYTVTLREQDGLYRVACLKRCFSLTTGKRLTPDQCGMPEWTEEIFYVHPTECNTVDGFYVRDWTGKDGIIPWLRDIRRYAEDNLEMLVKKGQEILEK